MKYSLSMTGLRRVSSGFWCPPSSTCSSSLAVGNGHRLAQIIAQLIIESVIVVPLCLGPAVQAPVQQHLHPDPAVRVLPTVCILVSVEEFGTRKTTQTVTGFVLIALQLLQLAFTGFLAIFILERAQHLLQGEPAHQAQERDGETAARQLTPLDTQS